MFRHASSISTLSQGSVECGVWIGVGSVGRGAWGGERSGLQAPDLNVARGRKEKERGQREGEKKFLV